jgi:hypothetical protein
MYRRILSPVLLFLALACLVYAIYRSTAEKIIVQEGNRQSTYGEPQHGLILGLCIFAGVCLAAAIALLPREVRKEERTALSKRVP